MSAAPGIVIARMLAKVALKYARNWAMKEARVRGEWVGELQSEKPVCREAAVQAGYCADSKCRLVLNAGRSPLFFRHESGYDYKFETPLITDGGSTPRMARGLVKKWADLEPFGKFKIPFYQHDSNYANAGCWVRLPREEALKYGVPVGPRAVHTDWVWMPLSRVMADTLMFQCMPCGGRNGEVNAIFRAVRVGGGAAWRRHRERTHV